MTAAHDYAELPHLVDTRLLASRSSAPRDNSFDTGPLVAAIDRSDKQHARRAALLESVNGSLMIPTTVILQVRCLAEERSHLGAAFLKSPHRVSSSTSPSPSATWAG